MSRCIYCLQILHLYIWHHIVFWIFFSVCIRFSLKSPRPGLQCSPNMFFLIYLNKWCQFVLCNQLMHSFIGFTKEKQEKFFASHYFHFYVTLINNNKKDSPLSILDKLLLPFLFRCSMFLISD